MKILITGGAGFIGSHLTDRLIKENHKVVVLDNLSTGKKENLTPHFFKKWGVNPRAKFYKIDVCSPKIFEILKKEKPEVIFHYAAQIDVRKSVEDPVQDAKTNILGSLNIIQNFISVNQHNNQRKSVFLKKFIFASTGGAIYGEAEIIPTPENYLAVPLSPYGIAKLTIEKYLNYYHKVFGLSYVSLRLANVYGPRQNSKGEAGVVAIFCDKLLNNKKPIINGDGTQTRDFVFVDDVVEANLLALEKDKVGLFNVGTGKETSVNEIFQKLKELMKIEIEPEYKEAKKGDLKRSCLDYSKIKKELGWQSRYSLDEGFKKTILYFSKKIKN